MYSALGVVSIREATEKGDDASPPLITLLGIPDRAALGRCGLIRSFAVFLFLGQLRTSSPFSELDADVWLGRQ